MDGEERDTENPPIPRERGYQPPIARIGAVLWTVAIASAAALALVADPERVPGGVGANLVVFGRVFAGVIAFAVVFPLAVRLRRGSPSGR